MTRAYRVGILSVADTERYMTDLYDKSSLFVTQVIVHLAIEELHRRLT